MRQTWSALLISSQIAGPNLTGTNVATTILPQQAKYTFPNNFWADDGMELRVTGMAQVSNIVTTPGTLTLDLRFGGTVIYTTGAMQLGATAHTTLPMEFYFALTLRASTGLTSNFMGSGRVMGQMFVVTAGTADSANTHTMLIVPNVTPVVGANFDNSATQQLDMFATFSLSNANAIQVQQFRVESLN